MAVNIEVLTWGLNEVIEPIPPKRRKDYKYYRGAHLGAIALSLSKDPKSLAVDDTNRGAHVTRLYPYALQMACNLAVPDAANLQFDESARQELEQTYGLSLPRTIPSVVFGIRADGPHIVKPSNWHGSVVRPLTIDSIDPYSAELICSIFDLQ